MRHQGAKKQQSRPADLENLRRICLGLDLSAIASLPPPKNSYNHLTAEELSEVSALFIAVWKSLVLGKPAKWPSVEIKANQFNQTITAKGEDAIVWLLFILCQNYDAVVLRLIEKIGIRTPVPTPGVDLEFLKQASKSFLKPRHTTLDRVAAFTYNYLYCLWASFLVCLMHQSGARSSIVLGLEEIAHDTANRLLDGLGEYRKESNEATVMLALTQSAFRTLSFAYHVLATRPRKAGELREFLDLNIHELSLLAVHDQFATEKYGEKGLEREFERQLSLLFQSFGFYVVTASPGERAVDLVCVPTSPQPAGVLLIDGKTSKHPYKLPVADQRALKEYFEHVCRTVTSLPRVTDILIVGPAPSTSLSERVRTLETELQVSVRYCPVAVLEDLREGLLGAVNHFDFFNALRLSSHVVGKQHIKELISRQRSKSDSVADLVKTFLGGTNTSAREKSRGAS
jgi:hypothetical protein